TGRIVHRAEDGEPRPVVYRLIEIRPRHRPQSGSGARQHRRHIELIRELVVECEHLVAGAPRQPCNQRRQSCGRVDYECDVRHFLHAPALRRMAATPISTSSSVVAHEEPLMRIAGRPCHSVPPHQQAPSDCTFAITARVTAGAPNDTSTWLITTSFRISWPAA